MKSMNKLAVAGGAVIIAAIVLGVIIFVNKEDVSTNGKSTATKNACDIFTNEDAKQVLGDAAVKSPNQVAESSSDDIEATSCLYQQSAGAGGEQKQASLLSRISKSKAGTESNKNYFNGSDKPSNAQDVDGYGDAAFWSSEYGQLNILKGNNWYILEVGGVTPESRNLDGTKKMADVIIGKL